jgi:cytochrome c-type biogenesis protein CcmH
MLPHVASDSDDARTIRENLSEARSRAKPATKHSGLRGTVSLSPALKDKVSPDDTVFVFARAVDGPPMPLAVQKARVRDLPLQFELNDSMAMNPAMKLSAFARVIVTARVSKSGTAASASGDLQGVSSPAANDAAGLAVLIDTVLP